MPSGRMSRYMQTHVSSWNTFCHSAIVHPRCMHILIHFNPTTHHNSATLQLSGIRGIGGMGVPEVARRNCASPSAGWAHANGAAASQSSHPCLTLGVLAPDTRHHRTPVGLHMHAQHSLAYPPFDLATSTRCIQAHVAYKHGLYVDSKTCDRPS